MENQHGEIGGHVYNVVREEHHLAVHIDGRWRIQIMPQGQDLILVAKHGEGVELAIVLEAKNNA